MYSHYNASKLTIHSEHLILVKQSSETVQQSRRFPHLHELVEIYQDYNDKLLKLVGFFNLRCICLTEI